LWAYNALPTALVVAFHRTYADLSSAASQEARRRGVNSRAMTRSPAPAGGPPKLALVSEPDAAARRLPLPVAELPPALRPIADRIETYWLARNGPRNRAVFLALLEELELVQRAAGCDSWWSCCARACRRAGQRSMAAAGSGGSQPRPHPRPQRCR